MVGRYRTHYIECGEGQPVILVHGGGPGALGEFGWHKNIEAIAKEHLELNHRELDEWR